MYVYIYICLCVYNQGLRYLKGIDYCSRCFMLDFLHGSFLYSLVILDCLASKSNFHQNLLVLPLDVGGVVCVRTVARSYWMHQSQ